ncbi:MAG: DNA alkylation repair protein [Aureispira sp.]
MNNRNNPNQLPEKVYEFSAVLNAEVVQELAQEIKAVWPPFEAQQFHQTTRAALEGKAIKERSQWVAEQLYRHLPQSFAQAGTILIQALGPPLKTTTGEHTSAFRYMPYGAYVSQYGLAEDDLELALQLMYEVTSRFTAEFAIRPFLKKYPQQLLSYLQRWVKDENVHVRRLVSEGTRPRLPWGARVTVFDANYQPILDLLSQLYQDPDLYVRRSVANHLNDLTKDRPAMVIQLLQQWQKEGSSEQLDWVIKHSLRTLIKAGDPTALALIGYGQQPQVAIENFEVAQAALPLGQQQRFSFELVSTSDEVQELLLDYTVYFMKANGAQKPKVFKLKTLTLGAKERVRFNKKHWFKHFSTRRLYAGAHQIQLQINGQVMAKIAFELVFPT